MKKEKSWFKDFLEVFTDPLVDIPKRRNYKRRNNLYKKTNSKRNLQGVENSTALELVRKNFTGQFADISNSLTLENLETAALKMNIKFPSDLPFATHVYFFIKFPFLQTGEDFDVGIYLPSYVQKRDINVVKNF